MNSRRSIVWLASPRHNASSTSHSARHACGPAHTAVRLDVDRDALRKRAPPAFAVTDEEHGTGPIPTRTTRVVDQPPSPNLGLSPSFVPQAYSVDPGACIITGAPADYEGFEAPQLRGISK